MNYNMLSKVAVRLTSALIGAAFILIVILPMLINVITDYLTSHASIF